MNERSVSYENKHNTTEEQQTNLTQKNRCADGAERNSNKSISILNVDGWVLFFIYLVLKRLFLSLLKNSLEIRHIYGYGEIWFSDCVGNLFNWNEFYMK